MDDLLVSARFRVLALKAQVEKGKAKGGAQPRHPAGTPLGGQWMGGGLKAALAGLFQSAGFSGFGAKTVADPNWGMKQSGPPAHTLSHKGSVKHPAKDDKGRDVYIHRPKTGSPPGKWGGPNTLVTVTPGQATPKSLNGVPFAPVAAPADWTKVWGQNAAIEKDLPDLAGHKHKYAAAGVVVTEADGRVWLTSPTNNFGGYRNTFPKGTQEPGLTLQQTAIKEAWEETGLKIAITGVLGDFERTTSVARYYTARRIGGDPASQGWESQALRLAPKSAMRSLLNVPVDRDILRLILDEHDLTKHRPNLDALFSEALRCSARVMALLEKAKGPGTGGKGDKAGHWQNQPRWPSGTPLGGQWKAYDGEGLPTPPVIGSSANPGHQLKAQAAYDAVKAGNIDQAVLLLKPMELKLHDKGLYSAGSYGKAENSQQKWAQQAHQYVADLIATNGLKTAAVAKVETLSGPPPLSSYKKIGAKPGGSNPGGIYEKDGVKYLVKGANHPSDDRAKNEVLASKLMQAAGIGAPDMHLVDLGKEHGGGLGVAAKMEDMTPWSKNSLSHLDKARSEFAVHAWLANYDAVGLPAGDNLAMKDGAVFNYDPGGALLYRAQGLPKSFPGGAMPHTVSEWDGMRNKSINAPAASVYGAMTATQLTLAAKKLLAVDDKAIANLVHAYGPGDATAKVKLIQALKARRDDILAKAGLIAAPAAAPPTPAPTPSAGAQIAGEASIGGAMAQVMGDAGILGPKFSANGKIFAPTTVAYDVKAHFVISGSLSSAAIHNAVHAINDGDAAAFVKAVSELKQWGADGSVGAARLLGALAAAKGMTLPDTAAKAPAAPQQASTAAGGAVSSAPTAYPHGTKLYQADLTNTEPGHNKFYKITVTKHGDGAVLTKTWGKIGTEGQTQNLPFPTVGKAVAEAKATIAAKKAKGYVGHEQTSAVVPKATAAAPSTTIISGAKQWMSEGTKTAFYAVSDKTTPGGSLDQSERAMFIGMLNKLSALGPMGNDEAQAVLVGLAKEVDAITAHPANGLGQAKAAMATLLYAVAGDFGPTVPDALAPHLANPAGQLLYPSGGDDNAKAIAAAKQLLDPSVLANIAPELKGAYIDTASTIQGIMTASVKLAAVGVMADISAAATQGKPGDLNAIKQHIDDTFGGLAADKLMAWADAVMQQAGLLEMDQAPSSSIGPFGGKDATAIAARAMKAADVAPGSQLGDWAKSAASAMYEGNAAGLSYALDAMHIIATSNYAEQSGKDAAKTLIGHFVKEANASGIVSLNGFVGPGGTAAKQGGMTALKAGDLTPAPIPLWGGIKGGIKARHQLMMVRVEAKTALTTADVDKLQAAFDKATAVANSFKIGTKGRLNSNLTRAWIVENAQKAGLIVEGGQFKAADGTKLTSSVKDAIQQQASVMVERLGHTTDSMIGQKVVTGLQALESGDDKGLATIIGGLALDGSPAAIVLSEKLTEMAEAKGGFPMATGSAATITSDSKFDYGDPSLNAEFGGVASKPTPPAVPNFQETTGTAVAYYQGVSDAMLKAYAAGDMAQLQKLATKKAGGPLWPTYKSGTFAGKPKGINAELMSKFHAQLVKDLTDHQSAAVQTKLAADVFAPSPGENVGNLPAMPRFDKQKIATTNTNAPSHNAKIDQIAKLAEKGDVKGLLGLKFGTNTYGKKQAALANDALAAMGSPFKVDPGQKKNSHPALTGAVTHAAAEAKAALTDKELPPKVDFLNWNGQGKGLSSSAHANQSNQAAFDQLTALAKAGDFDAIKNFKFQPINKDTGAPVGAPLPINSHPSQHVKNHADYLLQVMDEKLNPPKPLEIFEAKKAAASIAALSAKFPPKPLGSTSKKMPSSQTIGHYIAVGQVSGHDHLIPAKQHNYTPGQVQQAKDDYHKWSNDSAAQKFRSRVQGHGGHEYHPGWDDPSKPVGGYSGSVTGSQLMVEAKAAHKWARRQPAGTKIYKWENLTGDMKQKLKTAQPGLIIQNPAPSCGSKSETSTKGFGSSHRWTFVFTEGAKALNSFASGSHPGEQEVTLLPNSRYLILQHKPAGYGQDYAETIVLLLPPDPALDSDGYTYG
jgi:predicted DNA-binding WGR domain protein/ADP-ribose pyrophosphatase YjhB (NUDIX family)